ncbi:MAG: GGDEF domain-containing protein [Thiomicrospira sp.]|jgi:diguanylate cyclase (GGDEF)-like protein|nr:GGDEF domain-containing protein [Thiomicrospira sp.]
MNQQLESRVSERTSELVASEARMRHLAATDELTGLANRRAFWKALNQQVQLSRQLQQPLCLVMLDLDYFKVINDEHGHAAGDHALRSVSRIMQNLCENHQLIGRLGGEEFAIILPACDLNQAQVFAEAIRVAIQNQAKHPQNGKQLTVSIGVTQANAQDSSDSLSAKADKALYQAKNTGRNRSCVEIA